MDIQVVDKGLEKLLERLNVQESKETLSSKIERLQPLGQSWEWWNTEDDDIYDILYGDLLNE